MYNVSESFLNSIRGQSRIIKAEVGIGARPLTNIILNGSLINGVSNWSSSGTGTLTASNNEISNTITNVQAYASISQTYIPTVGHKYYISNYIKPFRTHNPSFYIGGATKTSSTVANAGVYTYSSVIITPISTANGIYYYDNGGTTNSMVVGSITYHKNMMCIDLTEKYGAGNEPTQAYMDNLMKKLIWFDGTIEASQTYLSDTDIVEFSVEDIFGSNNMPTIGGAVANKLNLTIMKSNAPSVLVGVPIRPWIAIDISNDNSGVYEWCPLGVFYALSDDVQVENTTIDFEALDVMGVIGNYNYDSILTFPTTAQNVLSEIGTNCSLTFKNPEIANFTITDKPTGKVRDVLGQIAGRVGCNVKSNKTGSMEFVKLNDTSFVIDARNYISFKLASPTKISFSQITVKNDSSDGITVGTGDGLSLTMTNQFIPDSDTLTALVTSLNYPLSFYAYTMKLQGMPHLDSGDIIQFIDKDNMYLPDNQKDIKPIIIANHKLTYNGGLISEFKVTSPSTDKNDVSLIGGSTVSHAVNLASKDFETALLEATKLITGNEGGHLIIIMDEISGKPKELVIADTDDINTAKNVWVWNVNGLGFSNTGYRPDGIYELALTPEGKISANLMTTGILTADIIKTGELKSKNNTSWVDMDDGTFSFANGRITFDGTRLSINYNGTNLEDALNAKANDADLTGVKTYFDFEDSGMTIGKKDAPQQITIDNVSLQLLDSGANKTLNTTAITGNGTTATATFTSQTTPPFIVGSTIEVSDAIPVGFNGKWIVTACTNTTVSWSSIVSGSATTQGTVEYAFIKNPNAVAYINGKQMYITDLIALNSASIGVHKIEKYDPTKENPNSGDEITIVRWVGGIN